MTIHIRSKEDADLLESALELLLKEAELGRSRWWKISRELPTEEERGTALSVRNMLTALNPHRWVNKSLFKQGTMY